MRELSVSEQRYQAVLAVISDGETVLSVAARFGVHRKTVHGWLARYEAEGLEGLADRSPLYRLLRAGGDTYVLAQILHDWDDEHCGVILGNCRQAIDSDGKLLVVEQVLPPANEPSLGKWLDLHMLVLLGGQERTESEYRSLLAAAGFELTRVIPTQAGASVVEAVPAA
jgi:transposase-like protein